MHRRIEMSLRRVWRLLRTRPAWRLRAWPCAVSLLLAAAPVVSSGDDAEASGSAAEEERSGVDLGQRLREILDDQHARGAGFWIYNDIPRGFEEARKSGKPLFVTFRCVPCSACAGFDAEVAKGSERITELAREKFVAVRQVEMKGVDLALFQFDYDLNWAAMFLNADGTIYARYGTQSAEGPDAYNSIDGLLATMRRVLEIHRAYPESEEALRGKRGETRPWKTALDMPGLRKREERRGPTARDNCIHCHMIHDAEHRQAREAGTFRWEMLWRYPLPENLGLVIDTDHGRRIEAVRPGSPAAAAGLEAGAEVTHVAGQLICSIADLQWALHGLDGGATRVEVRTAAGTTHELALEEGWKETDVSWLGSMWSVSPQLRIWAPELGAERREALGLAGDRGAFHVRWLNRSKPGGRAAFEAGLREGDVILRVGKDPLPRLTPPQLMAWIKREWSVGDELPVRVLRGDRELDLRIELVE